MPNFFRWKVLDEFAAQDMVKPAKLTLFIYFFTVSLLLFTLLFILLFCYAEVGREREARTEMIKKIGEKCGAS